MAQSSPRLPTVSVRIRRRAHVDTHPGHGPCVRTATGPGHGDAGRPCRGARADHLLRSVIIGGHAQRHRQAWSINVCRWELVLLIGDLLAIGGVTRTLPPHHRSPTPRGLTSLLTNKPSDCWSYRSAPASSWSAAPVTSPSECYIAATVPACRVFRGAWDGVGEGEVVPQPGGRQRPVGSGGVTHQSQGAMLTGSQLARLEQRGQPSRSQQ